MIFVSTPNDNPLIMEDREGTNDQPIIYAVCRDDEYRLRGRNLTGWVIDVGAHVGTFGICAAIDYPVQVVAVEAVPENAEVVAANAELNHVADRVFVESKVASSPGVEMDTIAYGYISVGVENAPSGAPVVQPEYIRDNYYVGNLFRYPKEEMDGINLTREAIWLDAILERYGIERVAMLKIDCEGCEWNFLASPAIGRVDFIAGEYHAGDGLAGVHALLDATHEVEAWTASGASHGTFGATVREGGAAAG